MPLDHLQLYDRGRFWVPQRLSDLSRLLINMIGGAPSMADISGYIPYQNIHSRFFELSEGLNNIRSSMNDIDHTSCIELAVRAKALLVSASGHESEECGEGLELLDKIFEIVEATRKRRLENGLADEDGEVTGD